MNFQIKPIILISLLTLSACETVDNDDRDRFYNMNCFQLAREAGRWDSKLSRAERDELEADIVGLLTDDKEDEDEADWDSLGANIDQGTAKEYLREISKVQRSKGCPVSE